jgi:hypothetical protein
VHDVFAGSGSDAFHAGELCDFEYELEGSSRINQLRWFDEDGDLVRRRRTIEENLLHRNADTGYELVETVHYTTDLDVASGLLRLTGNSWQLRTTDGRIILVLSGAEILRRFTGEVIWSTPNVGQGFEDVICPALGGAPA